MVFNGTVLVALFSFAWLTGLTFYVYRISSHYNKLVKGATGTNLKAILEDLLKHREVVGVKIEKVERSISQLNIEGRLHLSRVGIVRYNPFSDTGGSQSFSMALLNGSDNGIVVTSLFARSGNRWFVKEIINGKSRDLELSKEEESAIHRASVLKKP